MWCTYKAAEYCLIWLPGIQLVANLLSNKVLIIFRKKLLSPFCYHACWNYAALLSIPPSLLLPLHTPPPCCFGFFSRPHHQYSFSLLSPVFFSSFLLLFSLFLIRGAQPWSRRMKEEDCHVLHQRGIPDVITVWFSPMSPSWQWSEADLSHYGGLQDSSWTAVQEEAGKPTGV